MMSSEALLVQTESPSITLVGLAIAKLQECKDAMLREQCPFEATPFWVAETFR